MNRSLSRNGMNSPRFSLVVALFCIAAFSGGCAELEARGAVQDGNQLYTEGKYQAAVDKFEFAISKAPDLEIAHHNAGLAYLKLFEPGVDTPENIAVAMKAVEHFKAYLEHEPKDDKIVNVMVQVYIDAGKYEGAIAYWEGVLAKDGNNIKALTELGGINERALNYEKALEWHQKRREIAHNDEERLNALNAIGSLQFRRLLPPQGNEVVAEKRIALADAGIAAYQEAIALQPDNEQMYALLDVLYQQRARAHDVSWAIAIEQNSALVNRLKWRDIYMKKQGKDNGGSAEKKDESKGAPSKEPAESGSKDKDE